METEKIDELLGRYGAAEDRIAANLLDLHDHPTYGLITGQALTGSTARRLADVGRLAPSLWTGLDALGVVLGQARGLREGGRMNGERRAELAELLTGESVVLEVTETPLAERDLLGDEHVEHRVSIEGLLARLRDVYEPLRDGIADIDAVWRDLLPRLDAADTTAGELAAEVEQLAVTEPSLTLLRRRIAGVRTMVMDDPLGLDADTGSLLDDAVRAAALAVGQLRRGHDELDADLARTEVLVADARAHRARAAVALAESKVKVVQTDALATVPAEAMVDELARRADDLRSTIGEWQVHRVKLDEWLALAERLVGQLAAVEARNRRPLEHRDQLRGLLSAYRAKAAAVGLVERADVADLADEAHNELYTAPTDLARAADLMERLAAMIQGEAGGS